MAVLISLGLQVHVAVTERGFDQACIRVADDRVGQNIAVEDDVWIGEVIRQRQRDLIGVFLHRNGAERFDNLRGIVASFDVDRDGSKSRLWVGSSIAQAIVGHDVGEGVDTVVVLRWRVDNTVTDDDYGSTLSTR